jgi:transposase-like protein
MDPAVAHVYKLLPTRLDCVRHLEAARWPGKVECAICNSPKNVSIENGERHHCNSCLTTFSVTSRTVLHGMKGDLQKWILGLHIVIRSHRKFSSRVLAGMIAVDKTTACRMLRAIDCGLKTDREFLMAVIELKGLKWPELRKWLKI